MSGFFDHEEKNKKNHRPGSPQGLPGIENPPPTPDDRASAGISPGEIIKDRVGEITTGMEDHEPTAAAGDDDFLKKEAGRKDKAKGKYTRVTSLSYDEVDPS